VSAAACLPRHAGKPDEQPRGKRWFAVQTQPRKERLALHHLGNQQFETFCPLRRASRRIGASRVTALEPFFPSYAFVRLDLARDRWRSINGTIGVARLVCFGAEPIALPQGLIERFRGLCGKDGELAFDEELQSGDRVRIIGGPLDALCGLLIDAEPGKRVTVLLELLSSATQVRLARDRLMRA
jgi:transcriptional antiterminator RfaH